MQGVSLRATRGQSGDFLHIAGLEDVAWADLGGARTLLTFDSSSQKSAVSEGMAAGAFSKAALGAPGEDSCAPQARHKEQSDCT